MYEVLAPAGNLESLKEMLRAGADAVYVGLKDFSARPSHADFPAEELQEAIRCCHKEGVRLYIAANAHVGQGQMDRFLGQLLDLDAAGADALILSDPGVTHALAGHLQNAALHASTLMGVYNAETVRILQDMGVSRVIFHANLYFSEMAEIISAVPDLEYELVAEGGTCFNDIRQCQIPHGVRDGEHILFCRKPFQLLDGEKLLGEAKPISEPATRTAEIVGLFMAIGITSFKIEGRTVPAAQRIPMVQDLKRYIQIYQDRLNISASTEYLHYFSHGSWRGGI